jgi:asparagine synthase (glutamine-hydrolysing)
MCGIAGTYQQAEGKLITSVMVERLAHRGPDASAVLESVNPRASVVLGHLRLSIIDLSAAAD